MQGNRPFRMICAMGQIILPFFLFLAGIWLGCTISYGAEPVAGSAASPEQTPQAFSAPAELAAILSLTPADATLVAVADCRTIAGTKCFRALLTLPSSEPARTFLFDVLQHEAGFSLLTDLNAAAFIATSDHLGSAALILHGKFSPSRISAFLQARYGATPLPEFGPGACHLPFGKDRLFVAFPSAEIAVLTLRDVQMQTMRTVWRRESPSLSSSGVPLWLTPLIQAPRNAPAFVAFKDLGAFVGGQQPFALVHQVQAVAREKGDTLQAAFVAELPTPTDAGQFTQILNALQQLSAGYLKNVPRPQTSALLERITLSTQEKSTLANLELSLAEVIAIFRENTEGEHP